jgi:RNA-binding protein
MLALTNAQIRALKAQAQRLKATLKIGKEGLSSQFLAALDTALNHHELVKVKLDDFKEQKKELAPQLAEKSSSHLVTRVGNVVMLYRPKPEEEKKQRVGINEAGQRGFGLSVHEAPWIRRFPFPFPWGSKGGKWETPPQRPAAVQSIQGCPPRLGGSIAAFRRL